MIILLCMGGVYTLWLDFQIRREFEGKKWSIPARVYATPLELYPGQSLSLAALQGYLQELGYRQAVSIGTTTGAYAVRDNSLRFNTRPVAYWDGASSAQGLAVHFQSNRITEISNIRTGEPVSVIRIEPQLIGKVYPLHNEDRILVSKEEVPEFLVNALVAVEDRNFYSHQGIDLRGILRAFARNIMAGRIAQGGSTLTQQLVKNFFLTPDRTIRRKLNEMVMAVLLEAHYSKAQILNTYINEVYLGQHGARAIHGFGRAAEFYYARPLNELRDDQLAVLVALVRGASYYNPRRHPQRAQDRRNLVLDLMLEQQSITPEAHTIARNTSLDIVEQPGWTSARYPAFLDVVKRHLLQDYREQDLQNEGLKIFTTLDTRVQETLNRQARNRVALLERDNGLEPGRLQVAMVVANPGTGDILALMGGRDETAAGFNRAIDARRPIGSLVKPAIYLAAFSKPERYNLLTEIDEQEVRILQDDGTEWVPENYDRQLHGTVHLYEALTNSYNLAAIQLGMDLGIGTVIETISRTGIDGAINAYPSALLGAIDLSPLEVAGMYQTLANGGYHIPLNTIREVRDGNDRPLQRYGLKIEQALPPEPVYLLNHVLQEVVNSGTAQAVKPVLADRLPLAGKTGTTNDMRDSWFAGYGDNMVGVVWLGYDDNSPTKFTGATGALPVWVAVMQAAGIMPLQQVAPEGIAWLSRRHGLFSVQCPALMEVPYIQGASPQYRRTCYTQ